MQPFPLFDLAAGGLPVQPDAARPGAALPGAEPGAFLAAFAGEQGAAPARLPPGLSDGSGVAAALPLHLVPADDGAGSTAGLALWRPAEPGARLAAGMALLLGSAAQPTEEPVLRDPAGDNGSRPVAAFPPAEATDGNADSVRPDMAPPLAPPAPLAGSDDTDPDTVPPSRRADAPLPAAELRVPGAAGPAMPGAPLPAPVLDRVAEQVAAQRPAAPGRVDAFPGAAPARPALGSPADPAAPRAPEVTPPAAGASATARPDPGAAPLPSRAMPPPAEARQPGTGPEARPEIQPETRNETRPDPRPVPAPPVMAARQTPPLAAPAGAEAPEPEALPTGDAPSAATDDRPPLAEARPAPPAMPGKSGPDTPATALRQAADADPQPARVGKRAVRADRSADLPPPVGPVLRPDSGSAPAAALVPPQDVTPTDPARASAVSGDGAVTETAARGDAPGPERPGADAPRSSVPAPQLADAPRPAMRTMAEALHRAADGAVELTLSPEELGRVRLTLAPGENGITVTINADRADTLDLMRRHADLLGNAMRELGYGEVVLDFRGKGGRQGQAPDSAPTPGMTGDDSAPSAPPATAGRTMAAGGLDLRL
ncbi:flagellar hook-length control protein FliK [Rhodovulum steppense]|nr:flagellar hook-length control protein FliK [Rhodovulum steppense]